MGIEFTYWTAGLPLEKLTRPFAEAKSILPPPPRVPVSAPVTEDEEEPEALLEWGGGSGTQADVKTIVPAPIEDIDADGYLNDRFEGATYQIETTGGTKRRPERRPPQDDRPGMIALEEIDRQTIAGKVYNPDDAEQWVAVEAVKSIRFRVTVGAPDEARLSGRILKMNMKPKPFPTKPRTT